jgi:hypothetical protein
MDAIGAHDEVSGDGGAVFKGSHDFVSSVLGDMSV